MDDKKKIWFDEKYSYLQGIGKMGGWLGVLAYTEVEAEYFKCFPTSSLLVDYTKYISLYITREAE